MKAIKIGVLVIMALSLTISGCKKCKNEDPRARIINNGTKAVSVQIKTSGGNTENINNINPGSSSEYRSFAEGLTTFTISVDKINYVKDVVMDECFEYDIAIDANNNITSTPMDRND